MTGRSGSHQHREPPAIEVRLRELLLPIARSQRRAKSSCAIQDDGSLLLLDSFINVTRDDASAHVKREAKVATRPLVVLTNINKGHFFSDVDVFLGRTEINSLFVDVREGFRYDENARGAVSSAVRASRLHREGPPFKSVTAHHPFRVDRRTRIRGGRSSVG
jgi:hypothetical protein